MIGRAYRKIFPLSDVKLDSKLSSFLVSGKYPEVHSIERSIDQISNSRLSLSRFGDGEFSICLGRSIPFQKYQPDLAGRLKEILAYISDIPCLPAILQYQPSIYNEYWKYFWYDNFNSITSMLNVEQIYGNASLTRSFDLNSLDKFRQIWAKRSVVFVTGRGGRFRFTNELFDNINEYSFIYCDPVNAWSDYKEILASVKKHRTTSLILVSLGPTASVLTYDLANIGYQALDIGHLPNAYLQKKGQGGPVEKMAVSSEV